MFIAYLKKKIYSYFDTFKILLINKFKLSLIIFDICKIKLIIFDTFKDNAYNF